MLARALDELVDLVDAWLWLEERAGMVALAQHSQDPAHLAERLAADVLDSLQRRVRGGRLARRAVPVPLRPGRPSPRRYGATTACTSRAIRERSPATADRARSSCSAASKEIVCSSV